MVALNGIKNFLQLINDNWTLIVVILGLLLAVWKKVAAWMKLTDDEKINSAKFEIGHAMLKLVSDAEEDYQDWIKAGSIKRAQVVKAIFDKYPILLKVTNQEELIGWIDDTINNALKELRKVIAEQAENKVCDVNND